MNPCHGKRITDFEFYHCTANIQLSDSRIPILNLLNINYRTVLSENHVMFFLKMVTALNLCLKIASFLIKEEKC